MLHENCSKLFSLSSLFMKSWIDLEVKNWNQWTTVAIDRSLVAQNSSNNSCIKATTTHKIWCMHTEVSNGHGCPLKCLNFNVNPSVRISMFITQSTRFVPFNWVNWFCLHCFYSSYLKFFRYNSVIFITFHWVTNRYLVTDVISFSFKLISSIFLWDGLKYLKR